MLCRCGRPRRQSSTFAYKKRTLRTAKTVYVAGHRTGFSHGHGLWGVARRHGHADGRAARAPDTGLPACGQMAQAWHVLSCARPRWVLSVGFGYVLGCAVDRACTLLCTRRTWSAKASLSYYGPKGIPAIDIFNKAMKVPLQKRLDFF